MTKWQRNECRKLLDMQRPKGDKENWRFGYKFGCTVPDHMLGDPLVLVKIAEDHFGDSINRVREQIKKCLSCSTQAEWKAWKAQNV